MASTSHQSSSVSTFLHDPAMETLFDQAADTNTIIAEATAEMYLMSTMSPATLALYFPTDVEQLSQTEILDEACRVISETDDLLARYSYSSASPSEEKRRPEQ